MTPLGDEWIVGRDHELALLSRLVDALTTGRTGALLMTGGPGAGKSALLDAAARMARRSGVRVLRCRGSEGESGLAFAGLHQLLRPLLDLAEGLPARQRAALLGVFGLDDGTRTVSDPLLTSLGALTLLSDAAEHGPLLLVIDDTHWLDLGTLDVLAFVARRLEGEPVALLLAARDTAVPAQLDRQIDRLTIEPLDPAAAGRLLDHQPRPPAGRARSRVLEQAAGVPLALVELARAVARDPAAAHEDALPLTDRLEAIFAADLPEFPPATRALLLFAAAAESAELPVILSAVGDRATPDDWLPAERAGLVRIDADRVRFRHPLIRSAVYRAATYTERHTAHRALADVLVGDPDRRAWHHAAAASGVDEEAARELDDSAARAQRRGGYAAAATALERAARLSPDPTVRAGRLVRAATMAMYAGHPRWVGELSAQVATLTDQPALLAEASLLAGWALAVTTQFAGSLGFLLPVAEAAVDEDPVLTLDALATATTPAYNSGAPEHRENILRIVERVPPQDDETGRLWALAGCDPVRNRAQALGLLAATWTAPLPKPGSGVDVPLSRLVVSGGAAWVLDETAEAIRLLGAAMDHLRRSPTSGANATVAQALALALYESGSWTKARAALDEAYGLAAEGGLENVVVGAPVLRATLLALRGDTEEARAAVQRAVHGIDLPNCRSLQVRTHYALGAAALAEGDHAAAYDRFRAVYTRQPEPAPLHFHASDYYLADLVAAAVRTGRAEDARLVLDTTRRRLAKGETSARLTAIVHRAEALLAEPDDAERHFTAALADPAGDQWAFERAQVRLDYAEWLRRRRRAVEARPLLAAALEVFERLGTRPWTDRTRAELRAAGVTPASASASSPDGLAELTPQQLQIARLAAAGLTNREIGERIFLSPRTVGFHLYRIFPKLGITSRGQLRDALPEPGE
ncbi:helix-turn-helix transcriptional regulator [Streptomyces olivochromogenes]|uniref:Transcriptional regulator n=1 Tax=Streptomyces olivochromogenes TaxID=1963 RepID=A0A250V5W7_STROL|nr:helix-turn-helix transcriptional regulator [Streptomyces olivochromogenes]KUN49915.1 transcriptional regulator [Streptomyces olivochromogenes]GAX49567.1 transcriptional regulator [Streptomyces olivochromogenes]